MIYFYFLIYCRSNIFHTLIQTFFKLFYYWTYFLLLFRFVNIPPSRRGGGHSHGTAHPPCRGRARTPGVCPHFLHCLTVYIAALNSVPPGRGASSSSLSLNVSAVLALHTRPLPHSPSLTGASPRSSPQQAGCRKKKLPSPFPHPCVLFLL